MTSNNFSEDDFDELYQEDMGQDDIPANKRISVRYRRNDINATIEIRSLLFMRQIPVELLDISSKGAAIRSHTSLKLKKRVNLIVQFEDQKRFNINATVVHTQDAPRYGLKFDRYQDELAEHLLETQTDLQFS